MVDEMTERPVGRVPGRPFPNIEPYNLKRNFCYRPAAGAAEPSPTGQRQVVRSSSRPERRAEVGSSRTCLTSNEEWAEKPYKPSCQSKERAEGKG